MMEDSEAARAEGHRAGPKNGVNQEEVCDKTGPGDAVRAPASLSFHLHISSFPKRACCVFPLIGKGKNPK